MGLSTCYRGFQVESTGTVPGRGFFATALESRQVVGMERLTTMATPLTRGGTGVANSPGMTMKERILSFIFMCLLVVLPLSSAGFLSPVDQALSGVLDSIFSSFSPSATIAGPMPRELAMRRMVDRTARLLEAEGQDVDRAELLQIARYAEKASLKYRVSPSLIFSVIHTESRFRKTAMSPVGAIGLMQIQLETARHFAALKGLKQPTGMGLFDPETNVLLGTGYLRLLMDRFGDLRTALAAYHVGPTEIERRVVAREPFSDRYGSEIRTRETFYTLVAQPRTVVAANVTLPDEG